MASFYLLSIRMLLNEWMNDLTEIWQTPSLETIKKITWNQIHFISPKIISLSLEVMTAITLSPSSARPTPPWDWHKKKQRGLTVRGLRVRGRTVRGTNCPGLSGRVQTVRVRSVRPPTKWVCSVIFETAFCKTWSVARESFDFCKCSLLCQPRDVY